MDSKVEQLHFCLGDDYRVCCRLLLTLSLVDLKDVQGLLLSPSSAARRFVGALSSSSSSRFISSSPLCSPPSSLGLKERVSDDDFHSVLVNFKYNLSISCRFRYKITTQRVAIDLGVLRENASQSSSVSSAL